MKFNKPLLISSLLLLMANPAFASDDAAGSGTGEGAATNGMSPGDTQKFTVDVPEVSIIDVTNELKDVTLSPPKDAGDNFETVTVGGKPEYDISANVKEGTTNTRKIIASTSVPAGWLLTFNMTAPDSGTSLGDVTFDSTDSSVELVNKIGNVASKNKEIVIKVGPESSTVMPSYTVGAKTIKIIYTITADS